MVAIQGYFGAHDKLFAVDPVVRLAFDPSNPSLDAIKQMARLDRRRSIELDNVSLEVVDEKHASGGIKRNGKLYEL